MADKGVQAKKPKTRGMKYFAKCITKNGSHVILAMHAWSDVEVCEMLHKGYAIRMVIDLLNEQEMEREWAKIKPSLIQRSALK